MLSLGWNYPGGPWDAEFFAATASCRGRSAPMATTGGGEAHTRHPPAKLVGAQKRLENSH
jgi:hypothetical protein